MNEPGQDQQTIAGEARDWVLRLASSEMDDAELTSFRAWLARSEDHSRAFEQRRRLWQGVGDRPELFARAMRPGSNRHTAKRYRFRGWTRTQRARAAATAVAACTLAVIAGPEIMLRMEADHLTSAKVSRITLPDGSVAWLDARSAIGVDFGATRRDIRLLRGNAFFTVRHSGDGPFRVAVLGGAVEDIGTSFEVRQAPERVDVTVAEGAVRVEPRAGSAGGVLRTGEAAAYAPGDLLERRAARAGSALAAWRHNELLVERQSLSRVISEIARYRNGPTWIWAELDETRPINGAFRVADADAALRDLAAAQGLSITWLPGDIAIVRNGDRRR